MRSSLKLLNASAYRLQSECRKTVPPEPGATVDYQLLTQQVIQCAYDIAKAAKQLVTITTREKKQWPLLYPKNIILTKEAYRATKTWDTGEGRGLLTALDKTKATTFLAAYETSAPAGQIFNVQSLTKRNAILMPCTFIVTYKLP